MSAPSACRRPRRLAGLLAAVLALVGHIAAASAIWPTQAAQAHLAALDSLSVMCRGGQPTPRPRPPLHHSADEALCPAASAVAASPVLAAPDVALPLPPRTAAMRIPPPATARAPPTRPPAAAYPRGPPALA